MIRNPEHEIARLLRDQSPVGAAIPRAQADAVRRHRLLGLPVVFRHARRSLARPSEHQAKCDREVVDAAQIRPDAVISRLHEASKAEHVEIHPEAGIPAEVGVGLTRIK
jgi:hypothetical protein